MTSSAPGPTSTPCWRPGGVALAFFPTLWAPVFALNHMLPEKASRAIVHALFPARRDDGGDPKFPAFYDWCRGSRAKLEPMLQRAGFSDVHVQRFWGHGYFERMPGLAQVDHAFNAGAAQDRLGFRDDLRLCRGAQGRAPEARLLASPRSARCRGRLFASAASPRAWRGRQRRGSAQRRQAPDQPEHQIDMAPVVGVDLQALEDRDEQHRPEHDRMVLRQGVRRNTSVQPT